MAVRKIGNFYYAYYRDENGKLRTRSTGCTEKSGAVAWDNANMLQVRTRRSKLYFLRSNPELVSQSKEVESISGADDAQKAAHKRGTVKLADMLHIALTRRKTLSADHKRVWGLFSAGCGYLYADQITPKIALKYLDNNFAGMSAKTWNNNKSILNTIFRLCLVDAGLEMSPFAPIPNKLVIKSEVKSHRNLTLAEIDKIMDAKDVATVYKVMTMLSRWTAQRLETCARISFDLFDFERKVMIIDPGKTKRFNKWCCVPIFPPLEKYLLDIRPALKSESDPIVKSFGYKNNDLFSRRYVRMLKSLGIEDTDAGKASFHSLRGTAITWLKDTGVDAEMRHDITGQESKAIEDIYARSIQRISNLASKIEK